MDLQTAENITLCFNIIIIRGGGETRDDQTGYVTSIYLDMRTSPFPPNIYIYSYISSHPSNYTLEMYFTTTGYHGNGEHRL